MPLVPSPKGNGLSWLISFMKKKLYRSKSDVKISGVCGGLAVYFDIDSTLIRLIWIMLTLLTGGFLGIIMYLACVCMIPIESDIYEAEYKEKK